MSRKNKREHGGRPRTPREVYDQCVRIRQHLRQAVQPALREIYKTVIQLDRSVATMALEIRRRQLDDENEMNAP
jgi:hypothetical protein